MSRGHHSFSDKQLTESYQAHPSRARHSASHSAGLTTVKWYPAAPSLPARARCALDGTLHSTPSGTLAADDVHVHKYITVRQPIIFPGQNP